MTAFPRRRAGHEHSDVRTFPAGNPEDPGLNTRSITGTDYVTVGSSRFDFHASHPFLDLVFSHPLTIALGGTQHSNRPTLTAYIKSTASLKSFCFWIWMYLAAVKTRFLVCITRAGVRNEGRTRALHRPSLVPISRASANPQVDYPFNKIRPIKFGDMFETAYISTIKPNHS